MQKFQHRERFINKYFKIQISFILFSACITPIDLAFAFETTSAGEANLVDMKSFASSLVDHFKVSESASHISLSTFSETPGIISRFGKSHDPAKVKTQIANLKSDSGANSNIGDFLEYAAENLFTVEKGVRQSQPRVLVLFTNGVYPQDQEAKATAAAQKLKQQGKDVSIIVVNIGATPQLSLLESIASEPAVAKVISVPSSSDLLTEEVKSRAAIEICSGKFDEIYTKNAKQVFIWNHIYSYLITTLKYIKTIIKIRQNRTLSSDLILRLNTHLLGNFMN